ncbi:hypothetical protein [Cohnella cholangitidis]|uniref:Uncharacterized protein n=1 Tax=Cohnella cholangitidis TaxID=2598458 RepID=A0A7G5BVB5_9BACL|nr:hypothetical protein [Cohnella cholangitidis]QMV40899.1 hypothetical protein FPL14_06495 [Cohnella cholangitidis]
MLRVLFGEQPREWEGTSLETVRAIEQFAALSSKLAERLPEQSSKFRTYEIGRKGCFVQWMSLNRVVMRPSDIQDLFIPIS